MGRKAKAKLQPATPPPAIDYFETSDISRLIIILNYFDRSSIRAVIDAVDRENRSLIGGAYFSIRTVLEEKDKPKIISGFCIIDCQGAIEGRSLHSSRREHPPARLVILESAKEKISKLAQLLRELNIRGKIIYHPRVILPGSARLYSELQHRMRYIKLRWPLQHYVLKMQCGQCLHKIFQIINFCPNLEYAISAHLFPTYTELEEIDTNYGTFVSDFEAEGCEASPIAFKEQRTSIISVDTSRTSVSQLKPHDTVTYGIAKESYTNPTFNQKLTQRALQNRNPYDQARKLKLRLKQNLDFISDLEKKVQTARAASPPKEEWHEPFVEWKPLSFRDSLSQLEGDERPCFRWPMTTQPGEFNKVKNDLSKMQKDDLKIPREENIHLIQIPEIVKGFEASSMRKPLSYFGPQIFETVSPFLKLKAEMGC